MKDSPNMLSWRCFLKSLRGIGLDCSFGVEGVNGFLGEIIFLEKNYRKDTTNDRTEAQKKKNIKDARNFWVSWENPDAICFKFYDIICGDNAYQEITGAFSEIVTDEIIMNLRENALCITANLENIFHVAGYERSVRKSNKVHFRLV